MSTTTPGGESEVEGDNSSSVNNISSLLAERGTTATGGSGGRMDEEFDESSIEALNWSEADEEELQLQVKRNKNKSPVVVKTKVVVVVDDGEDVAVADSIEGELAAAAASLEDQSTLCSESQNDINVRMLSSSLLQSINFGSISGEDESVAGVNKSKKQVIENWASEVKEAADRGELEIEQEEEDGGTVDEENVEEDNFEGGMTVRNRKKKKRKSNDDEMTASVLSSLTTETGVDPLSNAPVLDDGPIWNKGPKHYKFQENRRINQKLTFGVLIAVVLAIGLGLGNLVAYNECETEYKQQVKSSSEPVQTTKDGPENKPSTLMPPASEVVENKQELPNIPSTSTLKTDVPVEEDKILVSEAILKHVKPDIEIDREQYTMQMQTLSKIVKTLDNLQRKIDNFENHTRHLGGVVMMNDPSDGRTSKDEESTTTTPRPESTTNTPRSESESYILDEQVHPDLPADTATTTINEDDLYTDEDKLADEEAFILELIDGIEETVTYLKLQADLKHLAKLEKRLDKEGSRSRLFEDKREKSPEELNEIRTIQAGMTIFKKAQEEFIKMERDELRERKILGLAEERQPEDYSAEEKAEIKAKYDKFMLEYPFKSEIEVEKERLKFVKDELIEEDTIEDDIDDFFKHYGSENKDDNLEDDLDFSFWGTMSGLVDDASSVSEDDDNTNAEVSPSAESIIQETSESSNTNNADALDESSVSQPDSDLKQRRKAFRKLKSQKKSRGTQDEEFGSGYGNGGRSKSKKRHSNKENQDGSGSDNNHKKQDKQKKKYEHGEQKPPKGNNFKGYDLTNNWGEQDQDDDDDDHKRKKYHSKSGEDYSNGHQAAKKSQEDSNWLLERTKVREEFRKETGSKLKSQQHQHSSSGKKAHNWQIERDLVRQKVRSKNDKNKSFDV